MSRWWQAGCESSPAFALEQLKRGEVEGARRGGGDRAEVARRQGEGDVVAARTEAERGGVRGCSGGQRRWLGTMARRARRSRGEQKGPAALGAGRDGVAGSGVRSPGWCRAARRGGDSCVAGGDWRNSGRGRLRRAGGQQEGRAAGCGWRSGRRQGAIAVAEAQGGDSCGAAVERDVGRRGEWRP